MNMNFSEKYIRESLRRGESVDIFFFFKFDCFRVQTYHRGAVLKEELPDEKIF